MGYLGSGHIGFGGATTNITNEIVQQIFGRDGVISGCQVIWQGDLDFHITAGLIQIDGIEYSVAATDLTLDAADGTHPRIDVIAADITAGPASVKITGTPAADPAKPEVDPDTQIELTHVDVAAGATVPTGVAEEQVYLDNAAEWTATASNARIDPDDVSDPDQGTKAVLFDAAQNGDNIVFADNALHGSLEFDALILRRKNVLANTINQDRLRVALQNGGTRVGNWVDVRDGDFGLSGSNTASYQTLSIPMEAFGLGSNQFDEVIVHVQTNGGRTLSLLLDDIRWQIGLSIIVQGVTQEDVDQTVLLKPERLEIACNDETSDIEVAAGVLTWRNLLYDMELDAIALGLNTAPTGSSAIFDANIDGATIMTTDKLEVEAGETSTLDATDQPVLTTTLFPKGSVLTIDCDQIGSTNAGTGPKVAIRYHQIGS